MTQKAVKSLYYCIVNYPTGTFKHVKQYSFNSRLAINPINCRILRFIDKGKYCMFDETESGEIIVLLYC